MPDQMAVDVQASLKLETVAGVAAAAGGGALMMRLLDSQGLKKGFTAVQSGEHRNDHVRPMPRLGGGDVGGNYVTELTVGGAVDELLQAVQRRTWAAPLTITTATTGFATGVVTVAVTATQATFTTSAGDWVAAGVRVGDVVTWTGLTTAANNNLRLRVIAVAPTIITTSLPPPQIGTLVAGASGSVWTLTRAKKLTTSGVPVRRTYTFEQHEFGVDGSELFTGVKCTQVELRLTPRGITQCTWTLIGMDGQVLSSAQAPWFTNASVTSGEPVLGDDTSIRFNGNEVAKFTGLTLTITVEASGLPALGQRAAAGVYDNDVTYSGNITIVREDHSRLAMLNSETEFQLHMLTQEPGADPRGAIGLYVPRAKLGDVETPFRGSTGPKIETLPLHIAPREAATGFDASALNLFSTAA